MRSTRSARFAGSLMACCLLFVACGGDDGYGSAYTPPTGDSVTSINDVSNPGDNDASLGTADSSAGETSSVSLTNPWPAGSWSVPQRLDHTAGAWPSLHRLVDGTIVAHYSDDHPSQANARPLFQRIWDGVGDWRAATQLASSGYRSALAWIGTTHELAVANAATLHLLHSDDGASWTTQPSSFAVSDDFLCDPQSAPQLVVDGTRRYLLFEFGYNSGVFGCASKVQLARYRDGNWSAATAIANQQPAGLYADGDLVVALTTRAILRSTNGGETFETLKGGNLTSEQLGGNSMAVDAQGRLVVVQTYSYANQSHLALLTSDDGGAKWQRLVLLSSATSISTPVVASGAGRLVVAYLQSDGTILGSYYKHQLYAVISLDGGQSWSAPQQLSASPTDHHVQSPGLLIDGAAIWATYAETGANPTSQWSGVYVTRFSAP